VTSAGLANDPDSLSKVSGGALSIENGHLKRANNVYFYATGLKTFGALMKVITIGFTFYPRISVEPKIGYRWRLIE
jgi:hypothetical protein